jgi:hypothetical protein
MLIRRTTRRTAVAATCAMAAVGTLSLAPAAIAGKPAPPSPTTSATAYSGEAQVVEADVYALAGLVQAHVDISKAGPLPATGGFDHAGLLQIGVQGPPLYLAANVATAKTAGAGDRSVSSASVADVGLALGAVDPSLLQIQASVLRSSAMAKCGQNGPELSGRSHIIALRIKEAGYELIDVVVTGQPNQVINLLGVAKITINEQIVSPGSITVNALHIELTPDEGLGSLLRPIVTGDVVISRSHADIACQGGENPPPPPPCQVKDFVTGGGQIGANDTSFGMVGGDKPNGRSGHFNLVDRRAGGPKVRGTELVDYEVLSATTRRLTYTGTKDGTPVTIVVVVTDNGEGASSPADTISVTTAGYSVSGPVGGNIQLHKPNGCGTTTTKGGPKK